MKLQSSNLWQVIIELCLQSRVYMKSRLLVSVMASLAFVGIATSPIPAQNRQPCKIGALVNSARESKKIRHPQHKFAFNIPANYSIDIQGDHHTDYLLLHNPSEQQLRSCCQKNKQIDCGSYPPVIVRIDPAKPNSHLLPDRNVQYPSRFEYIKQTTIANQKAVVYLFHSSRDGRTIAQISLTASFFTPNNKHKITIYAYSFQDKIHPIDEQVFQSVVSSFAFVK